MVSNTAGSDGKREVEAELSRARVQALHSYAILDTPSEPDFEAVVELAALLCDTPVAVINFISEDRQWFKAERGLGARETPLDVSICAHVLLRPGVTVIPDLSADDVFSCNPLVTAEGGLRFYAGAVLQNVGEPPLGTLCVLDTAPRPSGLNERQTLALSTLARQVMTLLELRRTLAERDAVHEREAFLSALGDDLRRQTDPLEVTIRAAGLLGPMIGVDRAGYGDIDAKGEVVAVHRDWTALGVQSLAGEARLLDGFGPAVIAELRAGRTLVVEDCLEDPRSMGEAYAAAWAGIGVRALIVAPLIKEGRLTAIVYAHQAEPRRWTERETVLVEGVAERTWEAVARARTDAALHELNETLEQRVAERTEERDRTWRLSNDLLAIFSLDGVLRRANPAWNTTLGFPPEEVEGRRHADLTHPEDRDRLEEAFAALRGGGGAAGFELRYRAAQGDYRWIAWTASAPEGDLVFAVGRDVTGEKTRQAELAQAQDALRQAQKLEAVGQLTGGVAHDFNNLLTVIRGSVELLMRPNVTEERRTRYIQAIADTATRATKLTGQLLAFARRQALRPEVFDVAESVSAVSDMVGTLMGGRIRIEMQLPEQPVFVDADPSQFDTALVNLAVNARDAMADEGRLTVTVRAVSGLPAIRNQPPVSGDFVAISLADTGSGIAPDKLDQIFEPFFTTKGVGQGTGLGLSQVYGFTKQSGGEVLVESAPGQGAAFTLYLPQAPAPANASGPSLAAEPMVDGQGACVLVVEDNPQVAKFATETLAELGYDTIAAADAPAALRALEENAARFDVVFSDVVMPGMTGIELAQEIRRRHADLPVVLASGYSHVLAEQGSHGFELLQKPYSIEALSRVLRKAARRRNPA
jgi:PAS domain S-box-containing protein